MTRLRRKENNVESFYWTQPRSALGDQRLDLCRSYAFQSPTDPSRTVIILNAIQMLTRSIPTPFTGSTRQRGDLLTDTALSYVFSKPQNGKQTFNVLLAKGAESRSAEAIGTKIVADAEVSFGPKPTSSRRATTRSSPAVAATPSSSISTASRICST